MMFPDYLDNFILENIHNTFQNKSVVTIRELAKKFLDGKEPNYNMINATEMTIRARLNSYVKKGFINKLQNSPVQYILNLDKLTFSRHKFGKKYKKCYIIPIDI